MPDYAAARYRSGCRGRTVAQLFALKGRNTAAQGNALFGPGGAAGCSHGWSAARREPGEAEPVEWNVQTISPPRQGRRCADPSESLAQSLRPFRGEEEDRNRTPRVPLVPARRDSLPPLIGIGAGLAARPLPHHRAYGSVHGGSVGYVSPHAVSRLNSPRPYHRRFGNAHSTARSWLARQGLGCRIAADFAHAGGIPRRTNWRKRRRG